VDADRSPTNVRVVPDLGDELLIVIDRLGALLGSVAIWEMEDDVGLQRQPRSIRRIQVQLAAP